MSCSSWRDAKPSSTSSTDYLGTYATRRPRRPYALIYCNDGQDSQGFHRFKEMLALLPFEFLLHLERIYLLKPAFKTKAQGLLTFGTVARFLNSKLTCLDSLDQLCDLLGFKLPDLHAFLPLSVRQLYFDRDEEERIATLKKMLSTADSHKPAKETKKDLSDYALDERGVPELLDMLIFYFKEHPEGLKAEGLFRKSVSIVEEEEALRKLKQADYNFLEKVENPHLPASTPVPTQIS